MKFLQLERMETAITKQLKLFILVKHLISYRVNKTSHNKALIRIYE